MSYSGRSNHANGILHTDKRESLDRPTIMPLKANSYYLLALQSSQLSPKNACITHQINIFHSVHP